MKKTGNRKHSVYTNSDIVVMAVCQLGGALRHIHLEDVAMKAAELSPKAFAWKKYPEQINLESVRIALKNELGLANGRVIGSIRDGWMVTPQGLSWYLTTTGTKSNDAIVDQLRQEIARAKKTAAFHKAINNKIEEVSAAEVKALIRIDEYFSARDRRERAVALANAAVLDPRLGLVVDNLERRGFKELEMKI